MSSLTPVDRFIRVLLEEIENDTSHSGNEPFTVAEIYQSLIPYRTHRDRLGVEMNGDYEDTLLRLLAGEGEFLILESEAARTRIRNELAQSNPNTAIYREYAAVGVRLNPDRTPARTPSTALSGSNESSRQPSLQMEGDALWVEGAETPRKGAAIAPPVPTPPPPMATSSSSAPAPPLSGKEVVSSPALVLQDGVDPHPCPECGKDLPHRDSLRFCPHCGANVLLAPCRKCGEVLERSWKFCLSCGTPAR